MDDIQENGNPAQQEEKKVRKLIGFTIGEYVFGTDFSAVHEIIRPTNVTEMPNAPDYVEGLMEMKGDIFPLVDLRRKMLLGEEKQPPALPWIIVIDIRGMLTGIKVDSVIRVPEIATDSVKNVTKENEYGIAAQYCEGICTSGELTIVLLDFSRIFPSSEG